MTSTKHLTQRDRVMLAEFIRRYIVRDIARRGLAKTYTPAALSVSAYDLHEFAMDLLLCADGDAVNLAESVARDVAEVIDDHDLANDSPAEDIAVRLPELALLRRLTDVTLAELEAERERNR